MKTLHLIISLAVVSLLMILSSQAYAVPYIPAQVRYFNSDIVLIGKVVSAAPFSPTDTKYEIQVEQYLKNPQPLDNITVIAAGTNKTLAGLGMTADTVFNVGQHALLYLKKEQGNYVAWWYSHPTDSLCDPAPTKEDLNLQPPQGVKFSDVPAYSPIRLEAGNSSSYLYEVNQPVLITYDAWNDHFTNKTFDVQFIIKTGSDSKVILNDTKQIELRPCIGHQTVTTTFVPKLAGRYEVSIVFDGSLMGTTLDIPQNLDNLTSEKTSILSPLKQIKSGIAFKDVKCKEGLQLVLKAEDGSPACLRPDTAYVLILKGWAKEFIQPIRETSSDLCGGSEVPSGDLRAGMVPVLLMKPNSTATICVTYQFISDWSSYPNKDIYPQGIFETCCLVHMQNSFAKTSSNQFEVLADPLLFNVTGVHNESKTTVVYKIHAGLDSKGFYDSSIPFGNCNSYPLAVGYDSSQVDASDFSYDMDIPCFYTIDKVDSVKIVSGMSYKQVTFR